MTKNTKNSSPSSNLHNSVGGGQNKFEILRQIQSESPKNQDNNTISFGGKTVKFSQVFTQNRTSLTAIYYNFFFIRTLVVKGCTCLLLRK